MALAKSGPQHVRDRQTRMLRTAFGPVVAALLEDPAVTDVLLNPDGKLWVERAGDGCRFTGHVIPEADAERIIRLVASHMRTEVHRGSPIVSAELPETGERFEGILPPVVMAPTFAIRKPATLLYTLDEYVRGGMMTARQAAFLEEAVRARKNILIAGGTGTGKTTLANALLIVVAATGDRVIIIEDTRELQCAADNLVPLKTATDVATLARLVRTTLRLLPYRIIVGEVRGAEALDMLKAWNTGHPGGIATIHANSALGALYRLEQLIQEAVVTVPRELIAEAIEIVVFLAGRGKHRRVATIAAMNGLANGTYDLRPLDDAAPSIAPTAS
jgi:P-type conjugative transfer ATPase TrbB